MKRTIQPPEPLPPEIIKTLDVSYREMAYREILWFVFSFIGFYSMAIILTGMSWLYFKNSPFGPFSFWTYCFCFLGIYGFFRSIKYAEKRIKIRPKNNKNQNLKGGIKDDGLLQKMQIAT